MTRLRRLIALVGRLAIYVLAGIGLRYLVDLWHDERELERMRWAAVARTRELFP